MSFGEGARISQRRMAAQRRGRTPKQVMNELQVAEAQRLMAAGTPLRDVAALAGFAHRSHFTSRFKMLTPTTPSRWLRGHRGRPALPAGADARSRVSVPARFC